MSSLQVDRRIARSCYATMLIVVGALASVPAAPSEPAKPKTTTTTAAPVKSAPVRTSPAIPLPPPRPGTTVKRSPEGSVIQTHRDGSRDIYNANRNMLIHHGPNGQIHVVAEANGRRIVAGRNGGYVQQAFLFKGRNLSRRTYVEGGRNYELFYATRPYNGSNLEVYASAHYFPESFYRWTYRPWPSRVSYSWSWVNSPWYNQNSSYFAPSPTYSEPSEWLTDYVFASVLGDSYVGDSRAVRRPAVPGATPTLTPQIKRQLADEIKLSLVQGKWEAQQNTESDGGGDTKDVVALLGDGQSHPFVVRRDLSVDNNRGLPCPLSQGDVVQVRSAASQADTTVAAVVLASRASQRCAGTVVPIEIGELQEMHNLMRDKVDRGMAELQAQQGQRGLPAAPPEATGQPTQAGFLQKAPDPDPRAALEISQTMNEVIRAEQETQATAK